MFVAAHYFEISYFHLLSVKLESETFINRKNTFRCSVLNELITSLYVFDIVIYCLIFLIKYETEPIDD